MISLFSGCGGMDLGLLYSGITSSVRDIKSDFEKNVEIECPFNIIYAIDNFKEAINTHKKNGIGKHTVYMIKGIFLSVI